MIALALSVLTVNAKPISREQAKVRAASFMKQKGDARKLSAVVNQKKLAPGKASVAADNGIAPYYVFDKGKSEGFVIVSGDDQTIDVLGYCDEGSFDYSQLPPNMKEWLDDYANQLARIQAGAPVIRKAASTHPKVDQLMTSKWSQGAPYNNSCPLDGGNRSVTGCVATAMAQILYYNREKSVTETQATIPAFSTWTKGINVSAVPAGSPIDWENMKDTYGSATDIQKKAVADLMFYCGASVKMDYTSSSSGAQSWDAYNAFINYFGYGSSTRFVSYSDGLTDTEWDNLVYAEMAAGRPIYISGSNASVGHAFVCDGYDGNLRYHINWGWGGQSDGYYYLTNLTPGDGQGIGGSSDGYNAYRQIVVGLEPENYQAKTMSFADAAVKNICLANWDTDHDGKLTYGEAAEVESLGTAFKGQTSLKSFKELYYFTSLTTLSDDAFNGCTQLETIKLPKALKTVGARAFKDCQKLKQVLLPTSVNAIGEEAFDGCSVLTGFELPGEISAIEKGTFRNCLLLLAMELPVSVEKIGDDAFAGCTKLSSFTVKTFHPENIEMGTSVFGGIDLSHATLTVMQGTKDYFASADQWKDFGNIKQVRELSGGNFATMEAGNTYYLYNIGTGRYLTKGEAWGAQAIVGTSPMRFKVNHTATMPEGVYYLTTPDAGKASDTYVFRTTTDNNVGQGVQAAFVDGANLTTNAYWSIQPIGNNIYTIQIPTDGANYAADNFWGVQTDHESSAASPTYGVYSDIDYATHKQNCHWQFVLYDEAVTARYEAAETLAALLLSAKKKQVKATDEQAVFDNLDSSLEELLAAQRSLRKKLNLIEFADAQVRSICIANYDSNFDGELSYTEAAETGDFTASFRNNTSLKSFDEFQYFKSAPSIYGSTFQGCTNLESIVLPSGLQHIYYYAFYNCKKLTKINIPEFVNQLGQACFYGCSALREVTVESPDPATITLGSNIFGGVPLTECTLYVPYGSKALYEEADTWKNFGKIVEIRGHVQPAYSAVENGLTGYVMNLGSRMQLTMGEAYGTQSVVSAKGRLYKWVRTNSMSEGVFYLQDVSTGKAVFRTNTDSKVGEGVKACFGDGAVSTKAYWQVEMDDDNTFTMQVPANDENYVADEYLGTDETHTSDVASPTNGIYWDIPGISRNSQWAFITEEAMQAAQQEETIVAQLKEMLAKAKAQSIDVTEEQAVYDNFESTTEELRVALKSVRDKLHFITFSDNAAQTICLTNWDADQDGELSFEEAAEVSEIGELFRGNDKMKYFEELKYFTSLTAIPNDAFRNTSNLVTLYLPKNIQSIGNNAFMACSKLRNLVIMNDAQVIPYGTCYLNAQATVFLPENMLSSYEADETWSAKAKRLTEYTGQPVVTAKASRIYGRTIATIETIVSGAPVEGQPEAECAAISDRYLPVGDYPITLKVGTIVTPGTELVEGVFTIEPAPLTITAKSYTRNVGEPNPEFEVTYKSFRNNEKEDVLTSQPVISCDATIDSPAGEYEITVSGAEAQNYAITYVAGKLTVVDPLGVESVKADPTGAQPIYDLQGRRVQQPKRGVYVSGNRKVVVK